MKYIHYFLIFNLFFVLPTNYGAVEKIKNKQNIDTKKVVMFGSVGLLLTCFFFYHFSKVSSNVSIETKGNNKKPAGKKKLKVQQDTEETASSYWNSAETNVAQKWLLSMAAMNLYRNTSTNNSDDLEIDDDQLNTAFSQDDQLKAAFLEYENNIIKSSLDDLEKNVINISYDLFLNEDSKLQLMYLQKRDIFAKDAVLNSTLNEEQIEQFNIVYYLTQTNILQILHENKVISRIFPNEIEIFKQNLINANINEKDHNYFINLLENIQCGVYKYIFGRNEYIELYAPTKIYHEQMAFLNKLVETIEGAMMIESLKWILLKNILKKILEKITLEQSNNDLVKVAQDAFDVIIKENSCNDEELKNEIQNQLFSAIEKFNNVSKEDQVKKVASLLQVVDGFIEYVPTIDLAPEFLTKGIYN